MKSINQCYSCVARHIPKLSRDMFYPLSWHIKEVKNREKLQCSKVQDPFVSSIYDFFMVSNWLKPSLKLTTHFKKTLFPSNVITKQQNKDLQHDLLQCLHTHVIHIFIIQDCNLSVLFDLASS